MRVNKKNTNAYKNLKKYKPILIVVVFYTTLLILLFVIITRLDAKDKKALEQPHKEGIQKALILAQKECLKESLAPNICSTLKVEAETNTESEGQPVWIIYIAAQDPEVYTAEVTVALNGNTVSYNRSGFKRLHH